MTKLTTEAQEVFVQKTKALLLDWARKGDCTLIYVLKSEESADSWMDDTKKFLDHPDEEILEYITNDPEALAQEIHQIGFDKGHSESVRFITELTQTLSDSDYRAIRGFIDQHEEHSH